MNTIKHVAGLVALTVALPLSANAGVTSYTVTDLGTLGGTFSEPFIVNKTGTVGGGATLANNAQHAVLWSNGQAQDLGTLGGTNSIVFGLTAGMVASGAAENATSDPNGEDFCGFATHLECLPFVWQANTMSALPTLGGNNGTALRSNRHGVIVGYAETSTPDPSCPAPQVLQFEPTVWTNGGAEALAIARRDNDGVAMGINDLGVVVGASGLCIAYNANTGLDLQARHALLWKHGKRTDLGNLGGKSGAALGNIAWAINDQNQVVGISDLAGDTTFHGFLWQNGTMSDLGTLSGDVASAAISINERGVVAGLSIDSSGNTRAVVWKNGKIKDLNALAQNSPLYLLTGCSINSAGEITGLGLTNGGDIHTYLAVPN